MPRNSINLGLPTVILTNLAGVLIDAVLNEETSDQWRISDIPLEDGAIANDHRAELPTTYSLNGRISDTPVIINRTVSTAYYAALGIDITQQSIQSAATGGIVLGNAIEAYNELRRVGKQDGFFTIFYGLGRMNNMQFSSLSVPRIAKDGLSIRFSAKLQQMLVTNAGAVLSENIATDANHTAAPAQNVGLQPTTPL